MPSCRFSAVALPPSRMWDQRRTVLQFLDSGGKCLWPTSRLCSPRESVLNECVIHTNRQPIPSWVFSLQGFLQPWRCGGSSPPLLPCACHRLPCRVAPTVKFGDALRSFTRQLLALPSSRLPTLLRFLATAFSQFNDAALWLIVSPKNPGDVAVPCDSS